MEFQSYFKRRYVLSTAVFPPVQKYVSLSGQPYFTPYPYRLLWHIHKKLFSFFPKSLTYLFHTSLGHKTEKERTTKLHTESTLVNEETGTLVL